MTENYEYKTVDVHKKNRELYGFWTQRLVARATAAMEKLTKDGWEPVNTTHDFMGNPHILTFRRKVSE